MAGGIIFQVACPSIRAYLCPILPNVSYGKIIKLWHIMYFFGFVSYLQQHPDMNHCSPAQAHFADIWFRWLSAPCDKALYQFILHGSWQTWLVGRGKQLPGSNSGFNTWGTQFVQRLKWIYELCPPWMKFHQIFQHEPTQALKSSGVDASSVMEEIVLRRSLNDFLVIFSKDVGLLLCYNKRPHPYHTTFQPLLWSKVTLSQLFMSTW